MEKYSGQKVYMGGETWVVPPLSLRQLRENYETIVTPVTSGSIEDVIVSRLPIILMAMQRNYPDLTEDKLLDMLDANTLLPTFFAVAGGSGLEAAKPGEV